MQPHSPLLPPAQDVVEVPSHLWEHFVADYRSLALIARHAESGDPMPRGLHAGLLATHAAFPALELQQQVGPARRSRRRGGPRGCGARAC
jgi:Zn-dependent oligopeptidase